MAKGIEDGVKRKQDMEDQSDEKRRKTEADDKEMEEAIAAVNGEQAEGRRCANGLQLKELAEIFPRTMQYGNDDTLNTQKHKLIS